MNKIFKVIYNRAKHCYVVACEFAKSYSKGGGSRTIRRAAVALLAAAVYAASGSALADNSGGTIDGNGNYVGNPTEYTVIIDSGFNGNVYGHKANSEEVKEASVTLESGIVNGHVYGGYAYNNSVLENKVSIRDGTVIGSVSGGMSYSGNAASNSVAIIGGTITQDVLGGISTSGDAASNSVNISGNSTRIDSRVCGALIEYAGSATYNIVNVSGGTISYVYGGYLNIGSGTACYNNVNISSGTIYSVYGGRSCEGTAASNSVNISGGTVTKNVFGGYSQSGNAASNSVYISGDTTSILGNIYGGVASTTGYADYNQVNISTGTLNIVYGGWSKEGSTASNSVDISGNLTKINEVYGGYVKSGTGSAIYNKVSISAGTVEVDVYGGWSEHSNAASNTVNISELNSQNQTNINGDVYGGRANNTGLAIYNKVNIYGGDLGSSDYCKVCGGYSNSGDAASNTVIIEENNGQLIQITSEVYGGYVENGTGSASYNLVTINKGRVSNSVIGGYSGSGSAASNTVNIGNVSLGSDVYGGWSNSYNASCYAASNTVNVFNGGNVGNGSVYGGYSYNGYVASNSVNISGGTVKYVYGGYSDGSGSVSSNTVNISNDAIVSCDAYGGKTNSGNIAASNTVNISSGGKVSQNVYGGWCEEKSIYNKVNIDGGKVTKDVNGGWSNKDVASNSVNISESDSQKPTEINNVYGGSTKSSSSSSSNYNYSSTQYNKVTISGGKIASVYGGYTDSYNTSSIAANNSVNISGGTVNYSVYGGHSYSGLSASNSVNISGGAIGSDGSDYGYIYGGFSKSGNAASNSVIISQSDSNNPTQINLDVYGGYVKESTGSAYENKVSISGGTVTKNVFGGYSQSGNAASNSVYISGDTTSILGNIYGGVASSTGIAYENKVNIATGTLKLVYGGYSESGSVASNSVNISDTNKIIKVYGGYVKSGTGSANYNFVNISGGTVDVEVYGGYVNSGSGNAVRNSVNISGGTVKGSVIGGYSYSHNAASNSVNISGGTVNSLVFGGYVQSGSGAVTSNKVNISSGTVCNVYGGTSNDSGNVASNSVYISGGTVNSNGYGGWSRNANAASNSVNISGDTTQILGNIYGGVASSTGIAYENKVNIATGTLKEVFGGYSESGNTASNSVTISGDSTFIKEPVYGGYVKSGTGSASYNIVNISGGTLGSVYGGWSDSGNAASNSINITGGTFGYVENGFTYIVYVCGGYSNRSDAASNSVKISGGTINSFVYGGQSSDSAAASNSVSICGGTINGSVYGGHSNGSSESANATSNSVNISGGTINSFVCGGRSSDSAAASNSVNISGGTFGSGSKIYAGYVSSNDSSIKDNCVNLGGNVTGLGNVEIYGFSGSDTHSGNELHIGRAVDLDDDGNIKRDSDGKIIYKADETTIWQGKNSGGTVNNYVNKVANFETISLHSVEWSNSLPALAADSFTYEDSTALGGNVTLDITDMTINDANASGIMTLLQSDTDKNFSELKLKYSDSEAAVIPDTGKVIKSTETNKTKETKGITLTYDKTQSIFLADSDTKVNYVFINTYKKSELGDMKWSEGGYSFSDNNAIDPSGLVVTFADDFKVEGAEDKNEADSIDLLDLSNVMGAGKFKEDIDRTKIIELQNDASSEMTFIIKRSDSIKSDLQLKKVVYTVGKSTDVSKVVFKSSIDWNSETPYYNNTAFDFTNNSEIDASKLEFTFSNSQRAALSDSSAMTLVSNAVNQTGNTAITYKNNAAVHSQQIDYSADNKTALSGTMTGAVNTSNSSINFAVNQMTLDNINLADWDGKNTSEVPNGWTANNNGVNVYGIFADPGLSAGESKNIISASNAMFEDEIIDEAIRYAKNGTFENDSDKGITLSGNYTGGVKATDEGKALTYYAMNKEVTDISLSSMDWGEGRSFSSNAIYDFKNVTEIDASELMFTNPEIMSGTMDIVDSAKNLKAGIAVTGSSHSQKFDSALDNKAVVYATLTGEVSVEAEKVKYVFEGITTNKFDLANWDGENASSVNTSWKLAEGATVETDGMSKLPDSEEEQQVFILKSDKEGYFANVAIKGENALTQKQFNDSDEAESVVLAGTQDLGVTLDSAKKNIIYKVGSKDVTSFKLNTIAWKDGAELLSRDKYNYSKLTALYTNDFNIKYEKPETISVNQSMTLLKANNTLADIAALEKSVNYQYEPVSGVTMDAIIRSSLEAKSGKVILTAASNKADKLTFGNVDWIDKGALIDHKTMLSNVSFDGAAVDTTKIAFVNKEKLDADMQMTLVSDFGGTPGSITGSKYKVGTAYEGQGSAYMEGNDLVFKTKGGLEVSEETHTTVMGAEAGMAALTAGNDHISAVMEQLGMAANAGADGVSTAASLGGGSSRNETGSHVDVNSWNITLAVGRNLEKKDGTFEYGLFGEYGRGSYTLHMDGVADGGSGNTKYTGGGLMAKFTNKHNVYTEASFRLGRMEDNASGILHDGAGNSYGYNEKAKYRGGHFGIGKICREEDGTKLEIYGKYFYNEREGINFAAGADQYSLDKVRSRVMRAGFRLSSTDKKWNRYGGIAYDYEFGGESRGTVNGTAIRSASVKGGTLRGEFGYCREATKTNPWKTDISLYGFTGKRQGFGGNIAFEYYF